MAKAASGSKVQPSKKTSSSAPSSNWKTLKKSLPQSSRESQKFISKRKKKSMTAREAQTGPTSTPSGSSATASSNLAASLLRVLNPDAQGSSSTETGKYVAMDCEFVGVGGRLSERSSLARVSIVNFHGHTVLDTFVRQKEHVTDYRTWVSGVRAQDLIDAPTFESVVKQVADILKDRVLVGHAVHNDLEVLLLSHPRSSTRDTASFKPLQELAKTKRPSLRNLAKLVLNIDIQSGEHSSVEDARATMAVFRAYKDQWDVQLSSKHAPQKQPIVHPRAAIDPSRRFRHSRTLGLASVAADEGLVLNQAVAKVDSTPETSTSSKPVQESNSQEDALDRAAADLFRASPSPPPFTKPQPRKGSGPMKARPAPQLSSANAQVEKRVRPPPSQDGWWNS